MRISVPGPSSRVVTVRTASASTRTRPLAGKREDRLRVGSATHLRRGFTLLELLVVLVLIAVLTSLISISAVPDPRQALTEQAQRLGLLLTLASDEARIRQQPISWEGDLHGYWFVSEAGGERQLLTDDDLLHERAWKRPLTRLAITRDGQSQALLSPDAPALRLPIAREWVQPRWRIELADGAVDVAVDFDENGSGRVANP
jgi:general secretion pathway protein H